MKTDNSVHLTNETGKSVNKKSSKKTLSKATSNHSAGSVASTDCNATSLINPPTYISHHLNQHLGLTTIGLNRMNEGDSFHTGLTLPTANSQFPSLNENEYFNSPNQDHLNFYNTINETLPSYNNNLLFNSSIDQASLSPMNSYAAYSPYNPYSSNLVYAPTMIQANLNQSNLHLNDNLTNGTFNMSLADSDANNKPNLINLTSNTDKTDSTVIPDFDSNFSSTLKSHQLTCL